MNTETINVIYGISWAILGAFIGWFTFWRIIKSTEYHKACVIFRSAFIDIQYIFNNPLTVYPLACITSCCPEQEKAIIAFEPYISKRRAAKMKEAYENYKNPLDKKGIRRSIFYYDATPDSGYTR